MAHPDKMSGERVAEGSGDAVAVGAGIRVGIGDDSMPSDKLVPVGFGWTGSVEELQAVLPAKTRIEPSSQARNRRMVFR